MSIAAALNREETGWLRQTPRLGDHLKEIEGLITRADIDEAKANWAAACDRMYRHARRRIKEIDRVAASTETLSSRSCLFSKHRVRSENTARSPRRSCAACRTSGDIPVPPPKPSEPFCCYESACTRAAAEESARASALCARWAADLGTASRGHETWRNPLELAGPRLGDPDPVGCLQEREFVVLRIQAVSSDPSGSWRALRQDRGLCRSASHALARAGRRPRDLLRQDREDDQHQCRLRPEHVL